MAYWTKSPMVDMSLHSDTLLWFRANHSLLLFLILIQNTAVYFTKYWLKPLKCSQLTYLIPISSVYNYVKYSVYFEILLYNGTNVSYTQDFQTSTYHKLPWLRVTVLKLYYRHVAPFRYITLISNQPLFTLNP